MSITRFGFCFGLSACAVLCASLIATAQTTTSVAHPQWQIGQPVVYEIADLEKGKYAPDSAKEEAARTGYLSTPVTKVGYGDLGGVTLNQSLPPGRYQASFEIGAVPYQNGELFVAVDVTAETKQSFRSRITPVDFPSAGFVTKSAEFSVPHGIIKSVEAKVRWQGPTDATTFHLKRVTITRIKGPLFLEKISTSKVLYKPNEKGTINLSIINGGKRTKATLVLSDETLIDQRQQLSTRDVELEAGSTTEISFPINAGPDQFGHLYRVEMRQDGRTIDSIADVASVSDHLWYVALGAVSTGLLQSTGRYKDQAIGQWVQSTREDYSNWLEKAFWAPDDWGDLTPDQDEWLSGQAFRYENKERLKKLIQAAHENGIRAISYGKAFSSGTAGLELARRKPDWFMANRLGIPLGRSIDTWDVDHWDDIHFHLQNLKSFTSSWLSLTPDLRQLEVLDHGINELAKSSEQFGWDGVRFDGHFSAGNDAMSTRNMQRMKKHLLDANPDYVFGYNIGSPLQYLNGFPHEIREAAAGGAHWMNEGIAYWSQPGGGRKYESWRDFAEQESRAAEMVRRLGGTYHFIYGLLGPGHNALQSMYKFAIGTAAGAHPVYGDQHFAAGSLNWGRYLTRWSILVWHPNLRLLTNKETVIQATASKPVWDWMASELVLANDRRLVITHLINPPPNDQIDVQSPQSIAHVTGGSMKLAVPAGETLAALYLVQPDSLEAVKLTLDDHNVAKLPTFQTWAMVVADLRGKYTPLPPIPQFTSPPDPDEVAAGMKGTGVIAAVDPLRSEKQSEVRADPLFEEAEDIFWSANQKPRLDPDASGGRAASYDKEMKNGTMAGYYSDIVPGRYKATARIKTINPSPDDEFVFHAYAEVARDHPRKVLKAVDFNGKYREVSLSVSYFGNQFICVFVQGSVKKGDEVVLLDWTKLELEEAFTDAKLWKDLPKKPKAVNRVGPPDKVLVLNGLYHQFLQIEDSLKDAFPNATITSLYQRDEPEKQDLAQYGTLVLADYALPPLTMRAAIRDWVRSGGHLVVFGGRYSLAQGNWKNTFLEDLLPATLQQPPDLFPLPKGSVLSDANQPLKGNPVAYYSHRVLPRTDSKVIWRTGKMPILLQRTVNKGRVTLFTGTVLGEAQGDETPFWQWDGWREALVKILR